MKQVLLDLLHYGEYQNWEEVEHDLKHSLKLCTNLSPVFVRENRFKTVYAERNEVYPERYIAIEKDSNWLFYVDNENDGPTNWNRVFSFKDES